MIHLAVCPTYPTNHLFEDTLLPHPRRGSRGIVFTRSVCLSVCVSVCLCVCVYVCLCVCLSNILIFYFSAISQHNPYYIFIVHVCLYIIWSFTFTRDICLLCDNERSICLLQWTVFHKKKRCIGNPMICQFTLWHVTCFGLEDMNWKT